MTPMRYVLTPSQKSFKETLGNVFGARDVARIREESRTSEAAATALMNRLTGGFPEAGEKVFGAVESIVALETIARAAPEAAASLAARAAFLKLDPALARAAVNLGSAEGRLWPRFERARAFPVSGPDDGTQALADLASAIESARLMLFRAAVLADAGKGDPMNAARAEELSAEIHSRARAVPGPIFQGENHES
jgi:hypothetical protein